MSQDSVSSEDFRREINESISAHDQLLSYSKESHTLILPEDMAFQQAVDMQNSAFQQATETPLPPPTPSENLPSTSSSTIVHVWTEEEMGILKEHKTYFLL